MKTSLEILDEHEYQLEMFHYDGSAQGAAFICGLMQDFAKMHVEAALKTASEKATAYAYYSSDNDGTYDASVQKESVLNAYPLTNIK